MTQNLSPGDSTVVFSVATELDGDSLAYDWITDARLISKDARPGDYEAYNATSNDEMLYRITVVPISDTA